MAEVPVSEAEVFEPLWLFHPSQPGGVLVETQDVYDKLQAQGGWVDTPTAFGLITAPNADQRVLQSAAVMPAPVVAVPQTGPALAVLERTVDDLTTQLAALQERLTAADDRLKALEEAKGASTAEQDKPPASRGRN